jgi:hypothetical protein
MNNDDKSLHFLIDMGAYGFEYVITEDEVNKNYYESGSIEDSNDDFDDSFSECYFLSKF